MVSKQKSAMHKPMSDPNPHKEVKENDIDYSAIYRLQENKQLIKRLRRTRNVLYFSSIAVLAGALLFWMMTNTLFTSKNFFLYLIISIILAILGFISEKRPFAALLTALLLCISISAVEIFLNTTDDLLVEGTIHKLFIISLLTYSLPSSKEAELIRKELKFS